jgi:hypothetical protein
MWGWIKCIYPTTDGGLDVIHGHVGINFSVILKRCGFTCIGSRQHWACCIPAAE